MIVKIFPLVPGFGAVRYNTNKAENDKGELMKVSGFGPLPAYSKVRPQDYVNYLEMISRRNTKIEYPQFHAVLSAKGRSVDKFKLTEMATAWLKEMGYEHQPYLIMFHKDRNNNHVHVVSTRVDKSGKKISSAYERVRAQTAMKKVMGQDEYYAAKQDLEKVKGYNFSTKAQFMLLLEEKGYRVLEKDKQFILVKYGKELLRVESAEIKEKLKHYQPDTKRAVQLTALLHKFRLEHDPVLREENLPSPEGSPVPKGATYNSDLAVYVQEKFGVKLIFHGQPGRPAYGYTVIDHAEKNVYKGGEVMDIAELLAVDSVMKEVDRPLTFESENVKISNGLIGTEESFATDPFGVKANSDVSSESKVFVLDQSQEPLSGGSSKVRINISDDVDDESIHGMRRKRKRKARTNLR